MTRARLHRWSIIIKLLRLIATPVVAWVRLARLLLNILRGNPGLTARALRMTPAILLAHSVAAFSMAWGALFGSGDTNTRFLDYELNGPRRLA
jgi:hypothetical protein